MVNNDMQLSNKSKEFLENLRVYLFSSGKNTNEIEEIVEELEVHLLEAEEKGKPVEKIIGQSPKEYMEQLSDEMSVDYKAWFKYIPFMIVGAFSFTIADDLLAGSLSYSLLEIIGHVMIGFIFIFGVFGVFKYISSNKISKWKQAIILYLTGSLPIGLFVGLIYLNRVIETPVIHFGQTGTAIIAIVTLIVLVWASWWAKTWVLPIILTLMTLPKYLLGLTALQEETILIVSTFVSFGGIAVYLVIVNKMEKAT